MKFALYQTAGTPGDVAANLAELEDAARAAAEGGARLLITTELFLSGYNLGETMRALAEPADGPSAGGAAEIAERHGIGLVYGYPERADGVVYNSAILIDGKGQTLANYRKSHLWGPDENRLFTPGSGWVVVDFEGVRVGLLICYDVEFPECARATALAGADLIAVPTATSTEFIGFPGILIPARALENVVYVAYANHCGSENGLDYCGESVIAAPDGTVLADAGTEPALLFAELDPAAHARRRAHLQYLEHRRPELYGDLVSR